MHHLTKEDIDAALEEAKRELREKLSEIAEGIISKITVAACTSRTVDEVVDRLTHDKSNTE